MVVTYRRLACGFVLAFGAASALAGAAGLDYPPTAKRPVTETFHGVTVVDDYRWMEDDSSPEVKAWVRDQNALTRKVLDAVAQRPEIARRVGELLRAQTVSRYDFHYRGGVVFAMKFAPPKDQPVLVALPRTLDVAGERVVLDPTVLDPRRPHDHRLLCSFLRWQIRGVVTVRQRQRGRHRLRHRGRDRQAPRRRSAARDVSDGRRQHRMGRRRQGFLLHALSRCRRTTRGGPALLSNGLVPQARHTDRGGSLCDRARISPHRRDRIGRESRRARSASASEERRRRRNSVLPATFRRIVAASRRLHRRHQANGVWPGRQSLRALGQGRAAWPHDRHSPRGWGLARPVWSCRKRPWRPTMSLSGIRACTCSIATAARPW